MGMRVPKKTFDLENLKFGLKFSVFATTTFDFDSEYLRNDSRYPKLERKVIDSDFLRVARKKVR